MKFGIAAVTVLCIGMLGGCEVDLFSDDSPLTSLAIHSSVVY